MMLTHPSESRQKTTKHVTKSKLYDNATRNWDPERRRDHAREEEEDNNRSRVRLHETKCTPSSSSSGKRHPPTLPFPRSGGGGGDPPEGEGEGPVRGSAPPSSSRRECFRADDGTDDGTDAPDDENDDTDDDENEEEQAPLFDSRFDTSDARPPSIRGVGWGVDYLASRRERKERRERRMDQEPDGREALELELELDLNLNLDLELEDGDDDRRPLRGSRGRGGNNEIPRDDDGFDDVDFESYRGRSFLSEIWGKNTRRRRRWQRRRDDPPNECWSNFLAFLILSLLAFAIVYESRDRHSDLETFLPWKSLRQNHHRLRHPDRNGTDHINRRHEPKNDAKNSAVDAIAAANEVDNHKETSTGMPLTPEQQKLKYQRDWEEYEMEVAQLLADSRPGWDVHSKHGGDATGIDNSQNGNSDTNADTNTNKGTHSHTENKINHQRDGNDGFEHHWVQYYDKNSREHYYYHVETNTTQWQRPPLVRGVVLLGFDAGSGKEYVIEKFEERGPDDVLEGGTDETMEDDDNSETNDREHVVENDDFYGHHAEDEEADSSFDAEKVLAKYKDSYWRWNHPFRHPAEVKDLFGPVDTPVFWRVPLSAATTVEQIMTHCYKMVVAGTTGSSDDGKVVLSKNVSDHLTIYTLENGAHYLNVDISTPEKIEKAKDLGLGSSGVADVLLTRYLYHAADLFQNTSRTGRCFTILRHPVERAVAMFHTLRAKGKLGNNRTLEEYADSEAEDNWMTRMITNQMEGALSRKHFDVAREVFGRKCLVGLTSKMDESIHRFARFFKWDMAERIRSDSGGRPPKATQEPEEKRSCSKTLADDGVNVHNYPQKGLSKDSTVWKKLARRNKYDIELYEYAEAMYYQQHVVYEQAGR